MSPPPTVVGIGEILWDLLPSGRQLGGAPANFAYCSHLLGTRAIVASRVGEDNLGQEIRESVLKAGMTNKFLEIDTLHPTGTVHVELGAGGQPRFVIAYPAAWDFLEATEEWRDLAESADAVCFGSLAQRSARARAAILSFLECTRPEALRVFDVNLRQTFYSLEVIENSVARASAVKLSHEELPILARLLGLDGSEAYAFCRQALERFELELVAITRGEKGSLLASPGGIDEHPGFHVRVRDAVGAGDAFTAGLVHERLRGGELEAMNDRANRMGAWVASCPGAMPGMPEGGLERALAELQLNTGRP